MWFAIIRLILIGGAWFRGAPGLVPSTLPMWGVGAGVGVVFSGFTAHFLASSYLRALFGTAPFFLLCSWLGVIQFGLWTSRSFATAPSTRVDVKFFLLPLTTLGGTRLHSRNLNNHSK